VLYRKKSERGHLSGPLVLKCLDRRSAKGNWSPLVLIGFLSMNVAKLDFRFAWSVWKVRWTDGLW
jgi:hypothetical protein